MPTVEPEPSDLLPTPPFYLFNSCVTTEDAVNAVVMMHETGGVHQVSLSAVARRLRLARSSVHQAHRGRAGFHVTLTELFCYRWRDWLRQGYDDPIPVRLPHDDMSRLGVLTWASLRVIAGSEAWAGRPDAWRWVESTRAFELRFVQKQIRSVAPGAEPIEPSLLEGLLTLADGLRHRMTAPVNPLGHGEATSILTTYWTRVLGLRLRSIDDGEQLSVRSAGVPSGAPNNCPSA